MTDRRRSTTATTALLLVVGLASSSACTTTETKARVIGRAGPVRDVAVVPAVDETQAKVVAGPEVFTDAELAAVQQRLATHLKDAVAAEDVRATTDPVGLNGILRSGTLTTTRLRLKASAGREQHRTFAECRVRVKVGDDVLVDVEGTALRLVQARNVSALELPDIERQMQENGGRHPLLDAEDSETALVEACRVAIAAVVDDTRPEDTDVDAAQGRGVARAARKEARLERRRRALLRLEQALAKSPRRDDAVAAALVDLGDTGGLPDADTVKAFHHDGHPLVQRAAQAALRTLCAGHALLPKDEGAVARCTPPAPPPPPPPVEAPPVPVDDEEGEDEGDGPVRVAPPASPSPSEEAPAPADTPPPPLTPPTPPTPTPTPSTTPATSEGGG
jgi:hypothetical protein